MWCPLMLLYLLRTYAVYQHCTSCLQDFTKHDLKTFNFIRITPGILGSKSNPKVRLNSFFILNFIHIIEICIKIYAKFFNFQRPISAKK